MAKTKPTVPFNVRLDSVVYNALCEHCELKGLTKTAAVDKALRRLLKIGAAK